MSQDTIDSLDVESWLEWHSSTPSTSTSSNSQASRNQSSPAEPESADDDGLSQRENIKILPGQGSDESSHKDIPKANAAPVGIAPGHEKQDDDDFAGLDFSKPLFSNAEEWKKDNLLDDMDCFLGKKLGCRSMDPNCNCEECQTNKNDFNSQVLDMFNELYPEY